MITFKIISYIIAFIWFAIILRWDVLTDYKKWLQSIAVRHTQEAIMRAIILVPTFVLLLWPKLHHEIIQWYSLSIIFVDVILIFSVWWEFFDGWYNRKRNFKWRFNGGIDKGDGILDKFLREIGDTWEGIIKWSLIVSSLTAYIIL